MKIPIEVSARHIHLSKEDLEKLFGQNYELKKFKQLTQHSDFSAEEVLNIRIGQRFLNNVRVVGPTREKTQIEISLTDAFNLGDIPPMRMSGDLAGSDGVTLVGPQGDVELNEGLILAQRHIHCSPEEAKETGIKDGDVVSVKVEGERSVTFHDIKVRVKEGYSMCLHIDTDEGNAAGINKRGFGELII